MLGLFGVHLSIRRAEKKETEKCSRPYRAKKSASTFLLPRKEKNTWRRRGPLKSQHRLGRPSETRRPGVRLMAPWELFTLYLGLPSADLGLTLG